MVKKEKDAAKLKGLTQALVPKKLLRAVTMLGAMQNKPKIRVWLDLVDDVQRRLRRTLVEMEKKLDKEGVALFDVEREGEEEAAAAVSKGLPYVPVPVGGRCESVHGVFGRCTLEAGHGEGHRAGVDEFWPG